MAKTSFKLVRKPRTPKLQFKIVRDEVRKGLEPVAKAAVKSRERIVANWEHKPKFGRRTIVTPKRIQIQILVKGTQKLNGGTATTADLWKWIDKTGTKPHPINPKKAGGKLRFISGGKGSYQSKTSANPARFGGPGIVRNGQSVVVSRVKKHPGFKPRKFSQAINRDLKPEFDKAIRNAYRRGFNKAKKV